jgi:carbon storage regulator
MDMLVLTRKIGQQIVIGKGVIQMKVLNADNGIIRIGINAPSNIDVDREEIYLQKITKQNLSASNGGKLGV